MLRCLIAARVSENLRQSLEEQRNTSKQRERGTILATFERRDPRHGDGLVGLARARQSEHAAVQLAQHSYYH
jgi:hypothetical protein